MSIRMLGQLALALLTATASAVAQAQASLVVEYAATETEKTIQLDRARMAQPAPPLIMATFAGALFCSVPAPLPTLQGFVRTYPTPALAQPEIQRLRPSADTDTALRQAAAHPAFTRTSTSPVSGFGGGGSSTITTNIVYVPAPPDPGSRIIRTFNSSDWTALGAGTTVTKTLASDCHTSAEFRGYLAEFVRVLNQYYGFGTNPQ